jgi:hypothetical protein
MFVISLSILFDYFIPNNSLNGLMIGSRNAVGEDWLGGLGSGVD